MIPISNFFQTSDGAWLCVVARQGNVDWEPMCRAVDREDLIKDERYTSAKGRRHNTRDLTKALDEGFAKFTKEEMAVRLDGESIAWAPVQTLAEVAADPQVMAAGAIVQVPSNTGGESFRLARISGEIPRREMMARKAPARTLGSTRATCSKMLVLAAMRLMNGWRRVSSARKPKASAAALFRPQSLSLSSAHTIRQSQHDRFAATISSCRQSYSKHKL